MSERKITVFGGTGLLGSAVVRQLAGDGHRIRVAARTADSATFAGLDESSWQPIACDIRDEGSVTRALDGADAAVNAVSLYVEKGGLTFEAIHVDGAGRIASRAREAGLERLIHISGIGSHVQSPSSYVRARAHGEAATREAFADATILSPSVLCAPGEGFLATMDAVTRLPVVPLFGRGDMRLQPVAVRDVARAVAEAIARPETRGRTFELGGAGVYSYRQIVQTILQHHGRKRMLMPWPMPLWHAMAAMLSVLPNPPLTRDQLHLIQEDNVVVQDAASFAELGLEPESLEEILARSPPLK